MLYYWREFNLAIFYDSPNRQIKVLAKFSRYTVFNVCKKFSITKLYNHHSKLVDTTNDSAHVHEKTYTGKEMIAQSFIQSYQLGTVLPQPPTILIVLGSSRGFLNGTAVPVLPTDSLHLSGHSTVNGGLSSLPWGLQEQEQHNVDYRLCVKSIETQK